MTESKRPTPWLAVIHRDALPTRARSIGTVDFRNFIVFWGRDPGTLKSDIVSKNIHN